MARTARWRASARVLLAALGGVSVHRIGQPEILAQRHALVFAAEQAAPPQLRHHLAAEIVEVAREHRRDDVEAVAGARGKPLLEPVGDLDCGALDDAMRTLADDPLVELAD